MRVDSFFLICSFLLLTLNLTAQQSLLQSGPMVGYSEMNEVMLWVQTKEEAKVRIGYWMKEKPAVKFFTSELITRKEDVFSVKLLADKVLPGSKYKYEVYINGKLLKFTWPLEFQTQSLYHHRINPPDFSFAAGSCAYVNDSVNDRPGPPFGGGYEIYPSIFSKKPDFMLWLGDNCYLREPDWNTRTGIAYRYTHTRSLPQLQPLLASVHHYAILDDHDYGPNDSDRSFWNKKNSIDIFNQFWCNPNTNLTEKGGITGTFRWNDVQFFLLDDRWFRSPNGRSDIKKCFLGNEQLEWLKDNLTFSNAVFKFICIGGPVLNPVKTKENYANYEEERNELLQFLETSRIPGVVFLTGDRHFTEITKLPRNGIYPLYDLTISPLLSRVFAGEEPNILREPGTHVTEKNFAVFKVEGDPDNRKFNVTIYNAAGEQLWTRDFFAKDLK